MKVRALNGGRDVAIANAEIAKALALVSFLGVARKDRSQQGLNLISRKVFPIELRQALTGEPPAEVNIIGGRPTTDEADLCDERTGTPIRATRHPNGDGVMAQTVFFERFFEFGDESGQIALGLGQGKPAGGQSNAGHRVEAQSTLHVAIFDAVFGQQLFDRWTLRGRNIRDD